MKVRIAGNKIRFRLKEPEVQQFRLEGSISAKLEFGFADTDQLTFTLSAYQQEDFSIQFASGHVTLFVPRLLADKWTSTEEVGFESAVDTGKGKVVNILVEKDFVCMDGREEDNIGSYPNPLANLP